MGMRTLDLGLVLTISLLGCAGDDAGREAPDAGTDDAGEDIDASVDAPAPDAEVIPPCTAAADTCSGDSICIAGACEAAFGRIYDVRSIDVTVPNFDPDGAAWDTVGGAPDLYVAIGVNGTLVTVTATLDNHYAASFAGPYPVQLLGGGSLSFDVYDEDVASSELAFICEARPLTAALLRKRTAACTLASGAALSFVIEPR